MSLVNDYIKQNLKPGNLEERVKLLEKTVENIENQLKLLIKGKKRGPKPKVDSIVTDITFENDNIIFKTSKNSYPIKMTNDEINKIITHLQNNKQYELKNFVCVC